MQNIIIVGGYGAVGNIIARELSAVFPGRVIIAGRNFEKARQLSKRLDGKVLPLQLDLRGHYDQDILANIYLVIMCIDQQDTRFVNSCIERGIDYIDISANQNLLEKIEAMDEDARKSGSRVILSVGLAPGLTNLLARHCLNRLGGADSLDLFILLGLGEKHGEYAYRWTMDNFHKEYEIGLAGGKRLLQSFTNPKTADLSGWRKFYLFDFADQHRLSKIPGLKEVMTRMAFDSRILTTAVALMRKLGLTRLFKNPKVQSFLIPVFRVLPFGTDIWQIKTTAEKNGRQISCSLKGHGEGKITAYTTVLVAKHLLSKAEGKGVMHIDELVIDIPGFLVGLEHYEQHIEIKMAD